MTTINDITARKQAEDALRASEERFALVIDASEQGIWDWNVETNEVFYSEQWKKQIGYQDNELKNDFNTWVEHLHPDESEDCQKAVYSYLNQPVEHFVLEFRFRHKDGSYRWIHNKASSLKNNEGKVIRMFGAHTDITERVQAEQTLKEYSARLEADVAERTRELRDTQEQLIRHEKLAVLGQLAGGVGHELRNPLAVILNAVYYLNLVQPEASEKIRQYHGMIEYEAHNAEKIITDLLDFARIKSVDREPVAVPELARRALERFPAPESVAVTFDFSPGLPKVFVDPRQVEQVLGNLVVNACQAMKDGGKLSVISEELSVDGVPWVRIAVKDTGTGIPPENMKKLFEPLFTTKLKGIGLGLAISQKLVEANGGKIEVQSEPGVGSTFTLYLPVLDK